MRARSGQQLPVLPRTVHNSTRAVTGSVVQAGNVYGGVHQYLLSSTVLRPEQLPGAPVSFAGRASELARLDTLLTSKGRPGENASVAVISGAGGVGKTCLALRWAHEHIDQFPDGQLYVNLGGFDSSGSPTAVQDVLLDFLDALGASSNSVPGCLDSQSAMFRSVTANKRILILLDNARDASQVVPLLPGTGSCTVLITSRQRLAALAVTHGAQMMCVDVMDDDSARELLAYHLEPGRLSSEPQALAQLIAVCAGLPLALRIVAARAADHPSFPLAVLVDELHKESARLDALGIDGAHVDLRAVLSWSYHALDPCAVRVLGLIASASGPDISQQAVAALTALTAAQTRYVLRDLENLSLVQQHLPGRYRIHDLVRLYAAERADRDLPASGRLAAHRRLAGFYLQTAYRGSRLLTAVDKLLETDPPVAECGPLPLADSAAALRWFSDEHACLLATHRFAVTQGWSATVWQLSYALDAFHLLRGRFRDSVRCWWYGLTALLQSGETATVVSAICLLGRACVGAGLYDIAVDLLGQALAAAQSANKIYLEARIRTVLTVAWLERGDLGRALEHAGHAFDLSRALGDELLQGRVLGNIGWCQAQLGNYGRARDACERALALLAHLESNDEPPVLDSLGFIAHRTGQHAGAVEYYKRALAQYREMGDAYREANTLARLGVAYVALDRTTDARAVWHRAVQLYVEQRREGDAKRVLRKLDELIRNLREL